jgi:tryptophan synthase alpha chain
MNRIEQKFKTLKEHKQKAFIAFITAGYPNLGVTEKLVLEFAKIGVDIIELGVPFSDPLADGPIIQEASEVALTKKTNLKAILNLVKRVRKTTQIPICLMSYYNPIFCFDEKRFVKQAQACGVDGVIIPDLPPEEGRSFIKLARKFNLDTIFFLSPTSTPQRIKMVSLVSKGFIYYVSLTGVTGVRKNLPTDLIANLKMVKRYTKKPVCVGFGISGPQHLKQIYKIADGAIVGSAIIKEIRRYIHKPDLAKRVARFILRLEKCITRKNSITG